MRLAVEAEIRRLSETLLCDPGALAFLSRFDAGELGQLRHVLERALDEKFRPIFKSVERASRLLPNTLTVKIAQKQFTPALVGRISSEMSPQRAASVIGHVDADYLAECAPFMVPERIKDAVGALPMETMLPVIRKVVDGRDHITMGRLLGALHERHVAAVVPLLQDGRDLLLVGFHCEDTSMLGALVAAMSDAQIEAVTEAAVEHGLEAELGYVVSHLDAAGRARILAIANDELATQLRAG